MKTMITESPTQTFTNFFATAAIKSLKRQKSKLTPPYFLTAQHFGQKRRLTTMEDIIKAFSEAQTRMAAVRRATEVNIVLYHCIAASILAFL